MGEYYNELGDIDFQSERQKLAKDMDTLERTLGNIEGKLDASVTELKRLNDALLNEIKMSYESRAKLNERIAKLEKEQVRQNTVTVTLAGFVSVFVFIVTTIIDWSSKLLK